MKVQAEEAAADTEMEFSNPQIPDYSAQTTESYYETPQRNVYRVSLSPLERLEMRCVKILEFLRVDSLLDLNLQPDESVSSQKIMK
jgi:hypothetical protein